MSKSNLLDSKTATLQELIGNGKTYTVPPYQRDYSWEPEQWEDLWNDLVELRAKPSESHYMGALVVEGKSDREFLIIDGQQRIATLSILALACIKRLEDLAAAGVEPEPNRERAKELKTHLISKRDAVSLTESSKLMLNKTDDGFYQDTLVRLRSPQNPRSLPKSNARLWSCFLWFSDKIRGLGLTEGAPIARLLSETVARQLVFIVITVDDELNAYTVFETLNARGLELSSTDLLKNYLFSLVKSKSDLGALQRRWHGLVETVKQERFPEFLRYHLLCEQSDIRKERLFKIMRGKVKSPPEVFALIDLLEPRSHQYDAFSDPEHDFWVGDAEAKDLIGVLKLFKVKQQTPLLFAAYEKFGRADFTRVLKLIVAVAFRYSIVGSRNPNAMESAYHAAAKGIMLGDIRTVAGVFEKLKPVYVDDEAFRTNFTSLEVDTSGQGRKLAKYILCQLESDAAGEPRHHETDRGTIEHILPENAGDDWDEAFAPDRREAYTYRVGNLTLQERTPNNRAGNDAYAEKLAAYRTCRYALTRNLIELAPEEWNPATLEERQKALADRAAVIWRSHFVQDTAGGR